jgi:hypothetical protein
MGPPGRVCRPAFQAPSPADEGLVMWTSRCCGCVLYWCGRAVTKPPTETIGIGAANRRERLTSRGISRGPRQCHDGGHSVTPRYLASAIMALLVWKSNQEQAVLFPLGPVAWGGPLPPKQPDTPCKSAPLSPAKIRSGLTFTIAIRSRSRGVRIGDHVNLAAAQDNWNTVPIQQPVDQYAHSLITTDPTPWFPALEGGPQGISRPGRVV